MGVHLFKKILKNHKIATTPNLAITGNVPNISKFFIDFNAIIHYMMEVTINKLNQCLIHLQNPDNNITKMTNLNIHEAYNQSIMNEYITITEAQLAYDYFTDNYPNFKNIDDFIDHDNIINIIHGEVIKYIDNLINSINVTKQLNMVYLSLDGVPSMSKMREQRNRRHNNSYIQLIKNDIAKKFKKEETNLIQIDLIIWKNMIVAGTNFMNTMEIELNKYSVTKTDLKIIVSGINENSEGEKKIMHYISDNINEFENSEICILSPDSDVVILSVFMYLQHLRKINSNIHVFTIEYHNENDYVFINTDKLIDNIFYLCDNTSTYPTGIANAYQFINDLFFVLLVFGNDFLPKIEPLDISYHFDLIVQICNKLTINEGINFVTKESINYEYLNRLFKELDINYSDMVLEKYMYDNYDNYYKLCKSLSIANVKNVTYANLYNKIIIVRNCFNVFMEYVNNIMCNDDNGYQIYEQFVQNDNDIYFVNVLPNILNIGKISDYWQKQLLVVRNDNKEFFNTLINYLKSVKNSMKKQNRTNQIKLSIKLDLYPKTHISRFDNNTNTYENEMNKFSNQFEPYYSMFNMKPVKFIHFDYSNSEITDYENKYYENNLNLNNF